MSAQPGIALPKGFKFVDIKMINELHMGTNIANAQSKKM
jgi:hypothetical protein